MYNRSDKFVYPHKSTKKNSLEILLKTNPHIKTFQPRYMMSINTVAEMISRNDMR